MDPKSVTYYSDEDIAGILLWPHGVFSVLATIFVGLRLYTARCVSDSKPRWTVDEIVCVAALVANHAMLISEGVASHFGLGKNMNVVATLPAGVTGVLKGLLAIEITYGTSCPLSKLSVLAMYYRIFSASKVVRYCVWVISSMLVGWGIAVVAVSIFSCTPVEGFWNPDMPSTCIDTPKFYIGITVPNIIFDVLTVIVPVREVWKLRMGRDKKLAATVIFLLGGSVVLASFARLVLFSIYRPGGGEHGNNFSQTDIMPHSASAIETCLAIIGACLPPCAPLFMRMFSTVRDIMPGTYGSTSASDEPKKLDTIITIGKISNRRGRGKRQTELDLEGSFVQIEDGSAEGSIDNLYGDGSGAGYNEGNDFTMGKDTNKHDDKKEGSGAVVTTRNLEQSHAGE